MKLPYGLLMMLHAVRCQADITDAATGNLASLHSWGSFTRVELLLRGKFISW